MAGFFSFMDAEGIRDRKGRTRKIQVMGFTIIGSEAEIPVRIGNKTLKDFKLIRVLFWNGEYFERLS